MTDYAKGSGSGSVGSGQGETNTVRLRPNALDPQDRRVICSAICKCDAMPSIGSEGQTLKQQCVSGRLRAMDALTDHQSPYKAEVNYDMSKDPPAPIMDSGIATKTHDYLPGWIQKYWPGGLADYTPGVGNIRRPDVVIVNDPSLPPTQDNLKSVVEIKFGDDSFTKTQRDAYERIAGDPAKVVAMNPQDCGCDDDAEQSETQSSFSEQAGDLFLKGLQSFLRSPPPALPPVFAP